MQGDALALASAACFAVANVTIVRGADPESGDNGAFLSLLLTAAISGALEGREPGGLLHRCEAPSITVQVDGAHFPGVRRPILARGRAAISFSTSRASLKAVFAAGTPQ